MSFEALKLAPPILKALTKCGHDTPTPVQREAIPRALSGRDLIASANTGTGKTAAFVLPALQKIFDDPSKKGLRVLVLTPTRELADQISRATSKYGRYMKAHSVAIYGGMPFGDQIRALSQSPEMIIATPGRLIDHIWRGRINLSNVELFVLDEADRMLDMGFIDDVEFVSDAMPEGCQTLLFAATMNPATSKLAQKFMKDPDRVELARNGKITHDKIEQRLHITDNFQHKGQILRHLCSGTDLIRSIVFSATKKEADTLARELRSEGFGVAALHGDMTQTVRNRTMENMRRGKIKILVATDVAARGIDITGISHVINFDLPRSAEDYVNRIGRTGRASESGVAISLVSHADFPYLERIERYIGQNLNVHVIPGLEPSRALTGIKKTKAPSQKSGKPRFGGARNRPTGQKSRNRSANSNCGASKK
ncbi:MAG: DEAD/DEAH box helicase [Deltaproteobacteria bacterium]|jgi:superfamily II DNA/RNA helicase|nr:DEAD/DEAH box helicase [Deltaproteobacteria bacterium]